MNTDFLPLFVATVSTSDHRSNDTTKGKATRPADGRRVVFDGIRAVGDGLQQ